MMEIRLSEDGVSSRPGIFQQPAKNHGSSISKAAESGPGACRS
jgi:hypothetical protein